MCRVENVLLTKVWIIVIFMELLGCYLVNLKKKKKNPLPPTMVSS